MPIKREFEQLLFNSKLNDAQNKIYVQWVLANKTDNCTVSHKHLTGSFLYKLNNGACSIIPYPTIEAKHIWQVYVTKELLLFLYYTRHYMILKSFGSTKIRNNSKTSNNVSRPIFLSMSTTRQVLTVSLLMEEALFTWAFRRWVSLFLSIYKSSRCRINKGSYKS